MPAWQVGDVTIERVEEFSSPGFHPSQQFPDFNPAIFDTFPELRDIDRIDPETGSTFASIHAWLVRRGDEIILVDTATGNDKERLDPKFGRFHMLSTDFLGELARHGVKPEDAMSSSTRTCMSTIPAGTHGWRTAAGSRPFPTPATSSAATNTPTGSPAA